MNLNMQKLLGIVSAVLVLAAGAAQAAVVTWDGSGDNQWTTPTDGTSWSGGTYNNGDDVVFNGSGTGTVDVQASGVTPGLFTLSSGTYLFDDVVNASSFTISGGVLQWAVDNGLGTGAINVTGNAQIESTKTTAPAPMGNSAINVSDGVTLTIRQRNPNNVGTGSPTVAPIHGGSIGNPIQLSIAHQNSQGRVRFSNGSTFTGDVYFDNRVIVEGYSDAQFGNAANKIIMRGLYGGSENEWGNTTARDIDIVTGCKLTGGELTGKVIEYGTAMAELPGSEVYFRNAASNLDPGGGFGGLSLNNGTFRTDVSFPVSRLVVVANNTNPRMRFSNTGPMSFSTSFQMTAGNTNPYRIEVDNASATVNLGGDMNDWSSGGAKTVSKTGLGRLNLVGTHSGTAGLSFQVVDGTLGLNSNMSGINNITVNSGGTLAGTGTIMPSGTTTFDTGARLAPGNSVGTLSIGGLTDINGAFTYNWEIDSSSEDLYAAGTLDFSGLTAAMLNIDNLIPNPGARLVLATDQLPVFTYTTSQSGFNAGIWSFAFSGYSLSGTPQLIDNGSGTIYLTGLTNMVPEPSTVLLLGVGGLLLWRRSRR